MTVVLREGRLPMGRPTLPRVAPGVAARGGDHRPPRRRLAAALAGLGPAVVAATAYVDPGNVATNVAAGSRQGYLLVWVVVAANVLAIFVQNLSAKLGLATGANLPRLCRAHLPRGLSRGLWLQAEVVAMATDVAEVVGGALALNLLFGLPLVHGAAVTAVVAFALMALQARGAGRFQLVVGGLFGVILLGFLVDVVAARPDLAAVGAGLVPRVDGPDSLVLATGILGATVMPHVIYLHSALTAESTDRSAPRADSAADRRLRLRHHRRGIAVALGLAGVVNLSMLVMAAALFSAPGEHVETIEAAHAGLASSLNHVAATLFALALLASGFASAGVGTYAGQVVMSGFLRRQVPMVVRRLAGLAPAVLLLVWGVDPTEALVLSQVVLSFGIPFALVPLVVLTSRRRVMGDLVNRTSTTVLAAVVSALVVGLNAVLVARLL